jgi:hypothetical protein
MIVGTLPTIFALNWCSSVSKFEHVQAQAMGIGSAFSNQTGPLGRDKTLLTICRSGLADGFGPRPVKGPKPPDER